MNSKELRIGNYINYEQTTHIIKELLEDVCTSEWAKAVESDPYTHNYDEITGIALTEELLLRLGFTVRNKTVSLNIGGELMRYALYEEIKKDKRIRFIIYFSKTKGWTLDSVTTQKETVYFNTIHELQNIFYFLSGGEELILAD